MSPLNYTIVLSFIASWFYVQKPVQMVTANPRFFIVLISVITLFSDFNPKFESKQKYELKKNVALDFPFKVNGVCSWKRLVKFQRPVVNDATKPHALMLKPWWNPMFHGYLSMVFKSNFSIFFYGLPYDESRSNPIFHWILPFFSSFRWHTVDRAVACHQGTAGC